MSTTRREVLFGASTLVAATALAAPAPSAAPSTPPRPAPLEIKPKPLRFDPKKLRGLSEKLLVSHWENNYSGAVKNLNKTRAELAGLTKDAPGFVVYGLKERELTFANSRLLHEAYFDNLGGDGLPSGTIAKALALRFGDFEALFRATAMSLAGGSGWVVLALDGSGELSVQWSGGHSQAGVAAQPLLVLDMYEHSYHLDFGAAAARYVDAFWTNIDWQIVDQRYEKALRAWKA